MTKQKFYEECVLKSYEYSRGTAYENEAGILCQHMQWPPKSFPELILMRTLVGLAPDIPEKQQFDKLGFEYLAQVTGFVIKCKDDDFTSHYFKFLNALAAKKRKKVVDLNDDGQVETLYDFYYETFTGTYQYKEFCEQMADFILTHCKGTSAYGRVLKLAYALGMTSKFGLFDFVNMKREQCGLNPVEDPFNVVKKMMS